VLRVQIVFDAEPKIKFLNQYSLITVLQFIGFKTSINLSVALLEMVLKTYEKNSRRLGRIVTKKKIKTKKFI